MAFARRSVLSRRPARPRLRGQAVPPPSPKLVVLAALERAGLALAYGAGSGVAQGAEGSGNGVPAAECAVIAAELRTVYATLRAMRVPG